MLSLQTVAHAADDEMKVLRMYFKEDELVVSPTRVLKRLSRTAENMEIITSEEIKRMNAHTLAEVLERVTGLFIQFFGNDFGSDANLSIQGSNNKQVLVLLDGLIWNTLIEGNVITNTIPVRIIKRIEIIKGPASSVWGSSLGGVVNIVTKEATKEKTVGGSISSSYGKGNTYDITSEISADAGPVRYYLYVGRQDSDGLRNERWFNNDTFYSKVNVQVSSDTDLMFTAGYTEPHISTGDLIVSDLRSSSTTRDFFATASINTELSDDLTFESSFYFLKQKFAQETDELTGQWSGVPGAMFKYTTIDEKTNAVSGKFVLFHNDHTSVFGVDYSYGTVEQIVNVGQYYTGISAPATTWSNSNITKWAVYANDTISINRLSVTPGIRYDHDSVMGSFISPSIGATYRANKNTVLKASMARGFNAPPVNATTAGGLFLDPNPGLTREKILSYQAGLESWAVGYLKVKLNMFHHDITNSLVKVKFVGPAPAFNDMYFNQGKSKRNGFEIVLETAPYYNVSLKTGYLFVHKRTYNATTTSTDTYAYNLALKYDDGMSLYAQLAGRYVWWDEAAGSMPEYDVFICDLNINRKLYSIGNINSNLFLSVHNIFNGSYYLSAEKKNPRRWVEAGLRIDF